jgi:hypothetical protein
MTPKQIKAMLPKKRKANDDYNTLMTRKELSKYFKVSPDAIDHYAKKKGLTAIRIEIDTPNGGGRQLIVHHRLSDFATWKPMHYRNSEWHQ